MLFYKRSLRVFLYFYVILCYLRLVSELTYGFYVYYNVLQEGT